MTKKCNTRNRSAITSTEYDEFKNLLNRIMAVPHTEMVKRETAYREQAALNPGKPGPKPKAKRKRASRAPAAS